jgi:amidase
LDNGIRDCFRTVITALSDTFKSLDRHDPNFSDARNCFWTLRCVNYLASHMERYEKHRDILSQNIIANVEAGMKMSLLDVSTAEVQWRKIYQDFEEIFKDIDLLIVPGNATPAFRIDEGIPHEINGEKMENYMDASLIRSALTLTGHPVVAIPCGYDHIGLPFGLQLVGKRRGDLELLKIAMALETTFSHTANLKRAIPDLEKL